MTLYDSMVESYAPKSAAERVAVQQEVMQLIALEFPGMRKYNRLCDYPNKDALLAAEPDEVKKVGDFSQNGTNYTAVVLSWIGFLPSGPAVFIYGDGAHCADGCDVLDGHPSATRNANGALRIRRI